MTKNNSEGKFLVFYLVRSQGGSITYMGENSSEKLSLMKTTVLIERLVLDFKGKLMETIVRHQYFS
ncbi:hypothetical protein ERO13_D03G131901v2 [Gossypium hirsutum]|uniref:Uncharacterized protein n=2 Tax=Gossypium TaxID=3633 RepID=A0A5J5S998_GOSBA|nr:hypothetical protein ES319_D03G154500v1 [Gossypium barbadense]KAG4155766.1 hypothetical protein ERO13_D03G131901v2 [Gossypium hirsutum]TYG77078.1 hypothetical protein ES288_D03G166300v1 [Gossypium darwinii]TYG77079.1 hypothetical protein ES288_D03G166300v1 [Gossypium darwinii]